MKPTRKLNRRSFMATVAGGVAAIGALGLVTDEAQAVQSGCTDSDSGPNSDSPGNGRSCYGRPRTGCTDSDTGYGSDSPGHGRCRARVRPRSGCTDSDSGRYADGVGHGRHCGGRPRTGITDRDPSDRPGYGRGWRRRRSCTDSDTGRYADPGGRGRHC